MQDTEIRYLMGLLLMFSMPYSNTIHALLSREENHDVYMYSYETNMTHQKSHKYKM